MKRYYILIVVFFLIQNVSGQNTYWSAVNENSITAQEERVIFPDKYNTQFLSLENYRSFFAAAPMEFTSAATTSALQIELPMPDKTTATFKIWESPVMAAGFAAQYPGIKTYTGQGVTDPTATVKIDFTYRGFHAMVLSPNGDVFIDPYFKNSFNYYISYFKKDFNPINKPVSICQGLKNANTSSSPTPLNPIGTQLRTYRLAVACTGEYSAFFGGTVANAASAIVTTVDRVNGVYERDLAIRLVLVANNNSIVFANAGSDPFTGNDDADILIDESQTVITNIIGNANFDIGHTFSTGAGGLAGLGVVCQSGLKASGVTGSDFPVGDPYDIDYVAHEIGHQFGGNHSFNGNMSACGGGNRNATTAYEVGSGSTIMAYAGICGTQDLQSNSDAYFHTISFQEIFNYISAGAGAGCAVVTATGNNPPNIPALVTSFTIPKNTPFTLTGQATDPDNDALSYCWEQFNVGSAGINTSASTSGPNFRSYTPVTSPTRTFPRINDIANNSTTFREVLYNGSTNRVFAFRFTARDNRAGGGGVRYVSNSLTVSGTFGPLAVTAPNTAVSWTTGTPQTVTWNVNSTSTAPINCANVNITLSTDGGLTYPVVLVNNTPNDGTESITVPGVNTTTARVRVECAFTGYTFFDISNVNFTISGPIPVTLLSFTAKADGARVITQWQTATEINSNKFILERSADAVNFSAIGEVKALGSSGTTRTYSFNDNNPFSGNNFYRLKIVDRDGSFKYSPVELVKFASVFDLQLSPNPANTFVDIKGKALKGNTTVKIFNASGKLVLSKQYSNIVVITEKLDVKNYPAGIYTVRIENNGNALNKRLIIVQ